MERWSCKEGTALPGWNNRLNIQFRFVIRAGFLSSGMTKQEHGLYVSVVFETKVYWLFETIQDSLMELIGSCTNLEQQHAHIVKSISQSLLAEY